MTIDELGYVEEMRQRLGLDENDKSKDLEIEEMEPLERVALIAGYELGDSSWAHTFKEWCESQGLYLTTDPDGKDNI